MDADDMSREARMEEYEDMLPSELAELLIDAEDQLKAWAPKIQELRALYAAGVDNWSGYDYAMEALNEGDQ